MNPPELDYSSIIKCIQDSVFNSTYEERNVSDCFELYDDYWQPQGNAVILVANQSLQTPANDSLLIYVTVVPRMDDWTKNMWAIGNGTGQFLATSPDYPVIDWYLGPKRYKVSRCLVQPPESIDTRCRFEYSPPIMITVCVLNFVKALVMMFIWAWRKRQDPLHQDLLKEHIYTLGDAISSFMRTPEERTRDMCLATKHDFIHRRTWKNLFVKQQPDPSRESRPWAADPRFWMQAASGRRWSILLTR